MKIKRIKYIDSSINSEQSNKIEAPFEIEAVGFVIEETDKHITLAQELIEGEFRGQLSIPKVAILK